MRIFTYIIILNCLVKEQNIITNNAFHLNSLDDEDFHHYVDSYDCLDEDFIIEDIIYEIFNDFSTECESESYML